MKTNVHYLAPFTVLILGSALLGGCQRQAAATHATSAPPALAPESSGSFVAPLANPVSVGVTDVAGLVDRLKPTVVNITTTSRPVSHDGPSPFGGNAPFPFPHDGPMPRGSALGTGFIVDPQGYVITNAHVIADADDIKVRLSDEREFPARVVGKDAKLDIALLRIEGATGISAAVLGNSDKLRVGESVIAIGNPFGLGHTVTLGIVSAKDRSIGAGPYDAFIQTDASINPGNSGGPLFNLRGEVVGIPTAIRQGAQGIGFAVPVNALSDILPQLRDKGSVSRGKLGVRIQHVTAELAKGLGLEQARGALVANVEKNGPGARAGLQPGDVITKVDGADVIHSEELPRLVARHQPGSKVTLAVMRDGKQRDVEATLDPLVDEEETDGSPSPKTPIPAAPGKLGVQSDDAPNGGARVRGVSPDSPAFGQLAPGDVVVELNHQPVKGAADLAKKLEGAASGSVALMRVTRGSDQRFVAIKLK